MKSIQIFTVFIILSSVFFQSYSQVDARMFSFPDVSATHITFTFAGDIWIFNLEAFEAENITDNDALPYAFKNMGIGPVIGMKNARHCRNQVV